MIRARENLIGARVFLVGLILAIVAGILSYFFGSKASELIINILALLGIITGFFVSEKDVQTFLLASVSLVVVSYMGISGLVLGAAVSGFSIQRAIAAVLQTLLALFVPATIIVAIKTMFSISKS
ncbi:hypothetical protein HYW75_04035 [Candidatus Pacearchaeota archaeon]|nr:hypothetical protein [Candidatus Pacearchaeota archaeon]